MEFKDTPIPTRHVSFAEVEMNLRAQANTLCGAHNCEVPGVGGVAKQGALVATRHARLFRAEVEEKQDR